MSASSGSAAAVGGGGGGGGAAGSLAVLRERLELLCSRLDGELARLCAPGGSLAGLGELQRRTGLRHSYLLLGGSTAALALLFLGLGAHFFSLLVGFAYPAWASLKAIEAADRDTHRGDERQWLAYWVIYGALTVIEVVGPM